MSTYLKIPKSFTLQQYFMKIIRKYNCRTPDKPIIE